MTIDMEKLTPEQEYLINQMNEVLSQPDNKDVKYSNMVLKTISLKDGRKANVELRLTPKDD